MINVVLDTNVFVSALLKPSSNPETILNLFLEHRAYTLCVSEEILDEYAYVFGYRKFKKYFSSDKVHMMLEVVRGSAHFVDCVPDIVPLIDKDDTKFLACAIGAQARYLVTGNTKDFPSGVYRGVAIVTPREFLHQFGAVFLDR